MRYVLLALASVPAALAAWVVWACSSDPRNDRALRQIEWVKVNARLTWRAMRRDWDC